MSESYDVVIIGAGHNGLVTAAYLARAGRRVLVLERRDVVGGVVVTEEFAPGFKASVGPDLCGLLLPEVRRDLDLDRHGLDVLPLDPVVYAPSPDGRDLTMWRDQEKTTAAIRRLSPHDAERYPAFAALVGDLAGFLRPLARQPPIQPDASGAPAMLDALKVGWSLRRLGRARMHEVLRVLPMSVQDFLDEWLELDLLKGVLAVQGLTGVALGPRSAGTSAIFLYHQLGAAAWPRVAWGLPRGGLGSISAALAGSAEAHGARIRLGAPVREVMVTDRRAAGVVLETGEEIAAPVVVSSLDPGTTFVHLLEPGVLEPEFLREVRCIRYRGVSARLLLALDRLPELRGVQGAAPQAQHHGVIHIGPNLDYLERAYDATKYGRFSEQPILEAMIPSLADPALAPEGKHVMTVTAQYAPFTLRDSSWAHHGGRLADVILATLEEHMPGLRDAVLHQRIITPWDLQEGYGQREGSLHQGEMALDQLYFMRPVAGWSSYRTPLDGLYLCGASTHPGGGVSGACGYNASQAILRG